MQSQAVIFHVAFFHVLSEVKFNACYRLSLGLFFATMFMSMWVANTAATAMMIPIIDTVLTQLEQVSLLKSIIFCVDEKKKSLFYIQFHSKDLVSCS